jgi:ATP-dependent RNA helicase DDX46/PRP5
MTSQAAFLSSLLAGASSASMMSSSSTGGTKPLKLVASSGGVITAEQLLLDSQPPLYTPNDWMSDAAAASEEEDDEEEQAKRRAMIEALKVAPVPGLEPPRPSSYDDSPDDENWPHRPVQLAAEVKSEKSRREEHMRELERQAEEARVLAEKAAAPELGRLFNDVESGVMEEAERDLAAAQAAPDALQVLAELNKKKELAAVDHTKVDYLPFTKNLYRVPRSLASLSNDEVVDRRAKLKVRVRGHGAPAPVSTFEECGLSEKVLKVLATQNIHAPVPVQAQCIPCIMAGRDVIGMYVAATNRELSGIRRHQGACVSVALMLLHES